MTHIQYFVSVALFGLIWTIQLVHYPAYKYVDEQRFVAFEKMHTYRITLFVAPLMLIELISLGSLLVLSSFSIEYMVLFIIVVLIWGATFLVSVPCHRVLAHGKDDLMIRKLIRTNWIRTCLWTLKCLVLVLWQ